MPYALYIHGSTDGFIPILYTLRVHQVSCLPAIHRSNLRLEIHPFRPSTGRVPSWEVPKGIWSSTKPHQLQIFHKWKETQLGPMICDLVDLGFAVRAIYIGWNLDCLQKRPSSKNQPPRSCIQKSHAFFRTARSVEMNFLISNRSCHVQMRTCVHNCVHSTATQGWSWRRPRCDNFGILAAGAV